MSDVSPPESTTPQPAPNVGPSRVVSSDSFQATVILGSVIAGASIVLAGVAGYALGSTNATNAAKSEHECSGMLYPTENMYDGVPSDPGALYPDMSEEDPNYSLYPDGSPYSDAPVYPQDPGMFDGFPNGNVPQVLPYPQGPGMDQVNPEYPGGFIPAQPFPGSEYETPGYVPGGENTGGYDSYPQQVQPGGEYDWYAPVTPSAPGGNYLGSGSASDMSDVLNMLQSFAQSLTQARELAASTPGAYDPSGANVPPMTAPGQSELTPDALADLLTSLSQQLLAR
jgi:hypothetical protein